MKQLLSIFILFLLIVSCDPCDDCNTVSFEPTVALVFINQDSIKNLNDSLAVFAFNDSALSVHESALDTLRDRLEEVQNGLDTGNTSLQSEKDKILKLIPERQSDSTFYATLNEDADSLTAVFNATKATINSGLVELDQIEILGTSTIFTYEDSATVWSIPLSYNEEFNQYEITIEGISDIIEFDYENFQEVDDTRNVLIRAKNIQIIDFTENKIDSILTNCNDNCVDGEATFTIYF
ncbi:hypothetical protein [Ekhidna lutea]|uniref:hypothetical protein n=1 Tax=Ekhidna lutea TaxID=447679 RepID=UPI00117C9EB2|nr:hypothetical protein [Ekhidna lutea]